MATKSLEKKLIAEMEKMPVIDAHEHLPPEKDRTGRKVDALTLFAHYTRTDLLSAGMPPEDYENALKPELPLDRRWKSFQPYLEQIRFGSYARPAFIAAKEFYGFDDINDQTYRPLSEAMQKANTPGIYRRILRDKCNIQVCLTQIGAIPDGDKDLLIPLMPMAYYYGITSIAQVEKLADELNRSVHSLEDYIEVMEAGVRRWKQQGAVGLKMASIPLQPARRGEAYSIFDRVREKDINPQEAEELRPLQHFLLQEMVRIAGENDLVVAIHSGMWSDFRTLAPGHVIPLIMKNPKTRFDLYHAGMPYVREAGVMGKNFPNCWLNLCWCHVISQEMTCSALNEWLDLVPVNKILGFGGDYRLPVEKVYGHLVMAREDIARVLASRIERGLMTEDQAVEIAHKWFYDNPKELYQLKKRLPAK